MQVAIRLLGIKSRAGYLTRQELLDEVNFYIKCAVVIEKTILPKAIIHSGNIAGFSVKFSPSTWHLVNKMPRPFNGKDFQEIVLNRFGNGGFLYQTEWEKFLLYGPLVLI